MRTTLDIPAPLIEEAQRLLGFKSKTDTVILSLQELIRRRRIEELKAMMGSVKLDIDIPASRRRPRRASASGSPTCWSVQSPRKGALLCGRWIRTSSAWQRLGCWRCTSQARDLEPPGGGSSSGAVLYADERDCALIGVSARRRILPFAVRGNSSTR